MYIFIIPFLFDYVVGGVFFITGYNLAEAGMNAFIVASPMVVWGISYAFNALIFGRIIHRGNAGFFLQLSGWATTGLSILFLVFTNLWLQLVWVLLLGVVSACYCIPFQIYSENSSPKHTLPNRTAGFYTFSWSLGTAAGALGFGCLSGQTGFLINAVIGLAIAGLTWFHQRSPKTVPAAAAEPETAMKDEVPDRIWAAWIFCGCAALLMAVVSSLIPLHGVQLKIGQAASGTALAVIRFVQGFVSLAMVYAGTWLFERKAFLLAAGFCIPGVVLLGGSSIVMLFSGAVLFGIFAGMFYFLLVFHALSHPARSGRYIGVNEMLLGLTGIAGPLLGGTAANSVSISIVFCACAVLIAAAAGIAITYKWENQSFNKNNQLSGGI